MTKDKRSGRSQAIFGPSGVMPTGVAFVCLGATIGLALLAGCASTPPPAAPARPSAPVSAGAQPEPQVVTDLSQLSDARTTTMVPIPTIQPGGLPSAPPSKAAKNEELTHSLAASAPSTRYDAEPLKFEGGSRLLNDKALQYAEFADILLNQTLQAAQTMAPEKLGQRRVPADLALTTLTAVMDAEGRLKEIIIEHHSGDLAVDKLFIAACERGIWSRNPPPGARASDGTYRLRLEGRVYNQSYDRYGQYSYATELGLALL